MTEDPTGFSQEEISKYLLEVPPRNVPENILVMKQGERKPIAMPIHEVEKFFGFTYRPHLTLPNDNAFRWILGQCPILLRYAFFAKENHELFVQNRRAIEEAIIPAVSIRWINQAKGYGLFAEEKIAARAYIAEYSGVVRRLWRLKQNTNVYCVFYPTILFSLNCCTIDAQKYGNVTRFINHADDPNLEIFALIDRGLLHVAFLARRDIEPGEELTFDYGPDFWRGRKKDQSSSLNR